MSTTQGTPRDERRPAGADRRLGGRLSLAALAAFLVAIPFTLLLLLVKSESSELKRLDRGVADRFNEVGLSNPAVVDVLDVLAVATHPWVFRAAVLAVAVWLWRRGARRLAVWALVTTVLGGVLGSTLKLVILRARPSFDEPVASAAGYSFPSGHALNSFLCAGILVLVFLPVLNRQRRTWAVVVAVVVVGVTGFGRVALGVHFVSDVLAGWVVAGACLAATAAAFEIWRREEGLAASSVTAGVDPDAADEMRADAPEEPPSASSVRG